MATTFITKEMPFRCQNCGWLGKPLEADGIPRCERCDMQCVDCKYESKSGCEPDECPECGSAFIETYEGQQREEEKKLGAWTEAVEG